MRLLVTFVFSILFVQAASADRMETRIHKIEYSDTPKYPHLLLLENGRVATVSAEDKSQLQSFENARSSQAIMEIEVSDDNRLLSVASLGDSARENFGDPVPLGEAVNYDPTNLSSISEAQSIFYRMNGRHQRNSQCYNRAHIWAYEEWKRTNFQSVKLFMFFTKRYIWDYNYRWWFHVTPLTYVNGTPMTLDRTFSRGPLSIKDWTLDFIYSQRDCPIVSKYSQYENNQQTEHCYLIPATMYFWQPRDLDHYEKTGEEKKSFIRSEINHAYWEAF